MKDSRNSILAVSPDRDLAQFRHEALAGAGFDIFSVNTECAARYEISFGRCGVLLLCHKLRKQSREDLAGYFHQRCPHPRVVSILAHRRDSYPPETSLCVLHSSNPQMLVQVLRTRLAA